MAGDVQMRNNLTIIKGSAWFKQFHIKIKLRQIQTLTCSWSTRVELQFKCDSVSPADLAQYTLPCCWAVPEIIRISPVETFSDEWSTINIWSTAFTHINEGEVIVSPSWWRCTPSLVLNSERSVSKLHKETKRG